MSAKVSIKDYLNVFLNVQKGERLKVSLLFSWLFLFICVYYVLRPVRRGLILAGLGNDKMPFVYLGTALVTGLVVWIYSRFTHLPRKTLIGTIYAIFFVNLLAWWQAFQFESAITSGLFWIWLDVFSIMGVTLFWMYANDIFDSAGAKRLFGVVAAGGGLGAVLGSSITAALVKQMGATNMLLVAAGLVGLTLLIFLLLERIPQERAARRAGTLEIDERSMSAMGKIVSLVFSNKFLFFLTMVVCFERITPDLLQYLYHEVLHTLASGSADIAALDANLERWRGVFEFGVEMFLVSAIIQRFGTSFALTSSAAVILTSLVGFGIFPTPFLVLGAFHMDEGIRHSWFKAAKELTYTVTGRDLLYSVKPVIEMFFYRFSRGLAGLLIYAVNSLLGLGTGGIIGLGAATAGCWIYCGLRLSTEYKRLELDASIEKLEPQPVA
jgi:AAA family ATP:ADP antiporter